MPTIEGYNFTVNLQDRGMAKTLRTLSTEARALKNVMRADFEEMRNGAGEMSAYSSRLETASTRMENLKKQAEMLRETISREQAEMSDKGWSDAGANRIARQVNQLERVRVNMAKLSRQMEEDRVKVRMLETGLDTFKRTTESVTTSTNALSTALKDQGKYYSSERASITGLRAQRASLQSQLKSEISATGVLRESQERMTAQYKETNVQLAKQETALKEARVQLKESAATYGENSAKAKTDAESVKKLEAAVKETKGSLAGYSESLSKNGVQLAKQAEEAEKTAKSYNDVKKASSGLSSTRIGSAFKAGSQHIKDFNNALHESTANTRKWWEESKGAFAGVGIAIGGVTAAGAKAVKTAADIQRRYVEVGNLLQTSGEKASQATRDVNRMQQEGVQLSMKYGYAQKDIANEYEELTRKGYSSTAALGSMSSMMKTARASGDDLDDVVKVTSQAIDAFGLRTDNATKMMKNSATVSNAMASAADRTAAGFKDMGVSMGYVSGSAKTVGWSVQETAAAIGELSNRGLEGTRAGTGLRQVLNSLIKPTKGATEALKSANLSMKDFQTSSGKLKDVDQIFQLINEHTKDMTKAEKGAFFKSVFGATGQQAAQLLADSASGLEKNDSNLTTLIKHINEDAKSDYVGRLARKNMQSSQMQMETLKRTAEAFEASIGAALLPSVNKVGRALAKWAVSKDGQQSMKDFSRAAGDAAKTVTDAMPTVKAFADGVGSGFKAFSDGIKPVVNAIKTGIGFIDKLSGGSHVISRTFGRVAGYLAGFYATSKLIRTVGSGILAVTKDTFTFTGKLGDALGKSKDKQSDLNAELRKTSDLLQDNIRLQQEFYEKQAKSAEEQETINGEDGGLSGSEKANIEKKADETHETYANRIEKDSEKSNINLDGTFKNAEKAGETGGSHGLKGMIESMKSKISGMSAEEKVNGALAVTFVGSDLLNNFDTAIHAKGGSAKASAYGGGIGGIVGAAIGSSLGVPGGTLIGEQLGNAMGPEVGKSVYKYINGVAQGKVVKNGKLVDATVNTNKGQNSLEKAWGQSHYMNIDAITHAKNPLDFVTGVGLLGYQMAGHAFDLDWWKRSLSGVLVQGKGTWLDKLTDGIIDFGKGFKLPKLSNRDQQRRGESDANWLQRVAGNHGSKLRLNASGFSLPKIKMPDFSKMFKGIKWPDFSKMFKGFKMPDFSKMFKGIKWPKIQMPKVDVKKWFSDLTKPFKNFKWPKLPKFKLPKIDAKKWVSGIVKDIQSGWKGFNKWIGDLSKKSNKGFKDAWKGMEKWANGVNKNVQSGWHGFTKWIGDVAHKSNKGFKDAWKGMKSWADGVNKNVQSGWHGFTKWAGDLAHKANTGFKEKWRGMQSWANGIQKNVQSGWHGFTNWSSNLSRNANKFFRDKWTGMRGWANGILGNVKSGWSGATSWFSSLGSKMVSGFKSAFNGLGSWMHGIVSSVESSVSSAESSVHSLMHKGHFANGTGKLTEPTMAVLNDGNDAPELQNREGILYEDGTVEIPSGRNITRLLLPGTQVIKSSDLAKLLGVKHFAEGTSGTSTKITEIINGKVDVNKLVHDVVDPSTKLGKQVLEVAKKGYEHAIKSAEETKRYRAKKEADKKKTTSKSKSTSKPKVSDITEFKPYGYFGNLKKAVQSSIGQEMWYDNTTLRQLGMSTGKGGGRFIKNNSKMVSAINKLYEHVKKANEATEKERKRKQAESKRKEAESNRRYKQRLEKEAAEYNERHSRGRSTSRRTTSSRSRSTSRTRSVASSVRSVAPRRTSSSSKSTRQTTTINIKETGASTVQRALDKIYKSLNSIYKKRNIKISIKGSSNLASGFGDEISGQGEKAVKGLKGKGNFSKQFDDMTKDFGKSRDNMKKDSEKGFKDMWTNLGKTTDKGTKDIESDQKKFSTKFHGGWTSFQTGIKKTFNSFWSGMKSDTRHGMNAVISELNTAIGRVNSVVHSFGGNTAVRQVKKLATGTGYFSGQRRAITEPTLAVLNDGNDSPETGNKEVIWTPGQNRFDVVPGRNTPALLQPGQEVFNATESKQLGFTHFATGTGALKQLYELAKKNWKNPKGTGEALFDQVSGLIGTINSLAQGMKNTTQKAGTDWWEQLWKMVEKKVNDDSGPAAGLLKAVEKYGEGHRYVWGAAGPDTFDCSGLVMYALKHAYGINYPHFSGSQYSMTQHISKENARMGDLVFWGSGGSEHVGVYAGGNKYFSAQSPSQGIHMNTLSSVVGYGAPLFGRVKGANTHGSKDEEVKVKTNNALQKQIKDQVGQGFWKTIQRIADKYGDDGSGGMAGKPTGDHTHWMEQAHIPKRYWDDMNYVVSHEAGWNPNATNPSSGTYGLGQMQGYNLHYYTKHGSKSNPIAQLMGTYDYMNERYGSPAGARRFWESHHWYANGGIAREASIFGEAGPEMAIPLSSNKLDRSRELVAQTLAALSENPSGLGGSSTLQAKENIQFQQNLLDALQNMSQMLEQLNNKQEIIETYVGIDGQKVAQKIDKYIRKNQTTRYNNGRLGRTNGI